MKGIVYLVQSKNLNYIGSTTQKLNRRVRDGHTCFKIYNFDINNYSVKVLEEIDFKNKLELYKLEQKYIDKYDCVNIKNTPISFSLSKKEADKQYYEKNKDERIKKASEYQKTDKAKLQRKKRYNNNKDKFKQYSKDNKERINEKRKELRERKITWGGDPRSNNNLLQIDVNIFH
jgi:hypothetical protein